MKFFFLSFILLTLTGYAQNDKLIGSWLMTRVEMGDKVKEPYFITEFNRNGKMLVMDMEVATWKYETKDGIIILESNLDKDSNGKEKILKLTGQELDVDKDGVKMFYQRVDRARMAEKNSASHLSGTWAMQGEKNSAAFLKFALPDSFIFFKATYGESETIRGAWLYCPDENAVILMGLSPSLRGKYAVKQADAKRLVLQKNGEILTGERYDADAAKIERLTFEEDELPEEYSGPYELPWLDFDQMVQFLGSVHSVKYQHGALVQEFDALSSTYDILSTIKVDKQKPGVRFTNLAIANGDTSQFSQDYKDGLAESFNDFFPRDEPWPYRIAGIEKVAVPAGVFECTVVEGFDGDKKVKFWMINDMPGIYAKIIQERIDPFGELEYTVDELKEIN